MKPKILLLLLGTALGSFFVRGQNETSKWYFGYGAGLDFMTTPPTILTNGAMNVAEGCASAADASGNLLFYTDGMTIYNSSHAVMANGTGLLGNNTPTQSSLIIKKPGSTTLYYVFTVQGVGGSAGFNYSIVDMSLASGQGSVTVKNSSLYSGSCGEKLTGTRHCNGVDFWVVVRDWNLSGSINFRAYLLTNTGMNTTAVVSPAWSWTNQTSYYDLGAMKIAPNGKKIGLAIYNNYWNSSATNNHSFELYDFDNTTGVVSNSLALGNWTNTSNYYNYGYGCEFSPDGTKFYGTRFYNGSNNQGGIYQFDLCAGSPSAVVSSETLVGTNSVTTGYWFGSMQIAKNGKIYIANYNNLSQQAISVINNPNLLGAACNFSLYAQSIAPKICYYGLPNFVGSFFATPPPAPPFTYTVSNAFGCQGVAFTTPITPNSTVSACSVTGFSLTNLVWNFGDPASGSQNISVSTNPIHAFTNLGTYNVSLILYYSCGGGTDTLRQVVNVNQPCISVSSSSITCAHLGSATVQATGGIGPFSYTWMPTAQTNSVATGLSPGTYTLTVFDFGNNFTYTATTAFTSLIPLTGSITATNSVSCFGASTGTGNITNLAGGSGHTLFQWHNTSTSYSTAYTNSLSAGIWSVSAVDSLTGCRIDQSFYLTQPPAMSLQVSSSSPSICAGTSLTLSGLNSGGTPGLLTPYTYSWTGGPATESMIATQSIPSTYVYTLSSVDSLNCSISNTISFTVITNPVLSVSNASICPLAVGTLSVSGASTYTWVTGSNNLAGTGNTFTDSPTSITQYTVIGSAFACTSMATGSISLYNTPAGNLYHNSPVCNGNTLSMYGNGGASYQWSGPNAFTSSLQGPNISNAAPYQSGVYNLTVTSAQGCTMSTSANLTVHPSPTVSAVGSTVCSNGIVNLSANSFTGSTFIWIGPLQYFSSGQTVSFSPISTAASGAYTVIATSPQTCTNSTVADVTVTALPQPSITSSPPQCDGNTMTMTTSGGTSYQWTGPLGFNSLSQTAQINLAPASASGIYTVTVNLGPCSATAIHSLTVWPLPSLTASSTPIVCETKTLGLYGGGSSNILSYIWAGPNNFSSIGASPIRTNCNLSYSGIYSLSVTDNNACQNYTTISVTIQQNPNLTASGATVCLNAPATLVANGANSYFWSGVQFYQSSAQNATIASVTKAMEGTYTVIGTAINTCTSVTIVDVATTELPQPLLSVRPSSIACPGTRFTLSATGGAKYKWYGPDNVYLEGQSVNFIPTNFAQTGSYTLVAFDSIGCSNHAETQLFLHTPPSGYLKADKIADCAPYCASYTFVATMGTAGKVGSMWSLDKTNYKNSFSTCFKTSGNYEFKGALLDSATGCKSETTFEVLAYERPSAKFDYLPQDPTVIDPISFTDVSVSSEHTTTWHISLDDKAIYRGPSMNYHFDEMGDYVVAMEIRDQNGCKDTMIKNIFVDEDFAAFVPNVFTPNNDQLNQYFYPVLRSIRFYKLEIYDRWGKRVYIGNQDDAGWDGSFNGQVCQQGVFTWILNIAAKDGKRRVLNGSVTLLR